ncbi:hypothetical protein [Emticicia sp. 21SJ11W-3]|uniref:hypothetical protein n=1 Tax=Emticicia sp. 21SJ11W-3 TaxID=2916755 RepID=UPI00209E950A|nr:hypothetical protein [Emticicia sp. 21SJ11W-3]UTA66983.1 hypothetical protein MB380_15410 [Emticicia sp. 21SJ11W-3]
MRVSEWLIKDPVLFDRVRKGTPLKVNKEVFNLLISKLRVYHQEYFRHALGLKTRIEFSGYDKPVQAAVPYATQPIEFYKWWSLNQDIVNLTLKEKIELFYKVFKKRPSILKEEHRRLITKN